MTDYDQLIAEKNALILQLCDTDYKAIKYAEGEIAPEDYVETKENRAAWRARINAIEEELASLSEDVGEILPPEDEN